MSQNQRMRMYFSCWDGKGPTAEEVLTPFEGSNDFGTISFFAEG